MCKENEVKLKRMASLFGMATMKLMEKDERIAELEEAVKRLSDDKALLIAARQGEIETVRSAPAAEELVPDEEEAQVDTQAPTVRIIRSRTPKGENPALFI